ncbi:MAG: hypothetical protein US03_C0007G0038 [candidate division TM6 bacterium GW2011_GWF2_36_131]|nr:MAG: hypothetical protein US03_C0007G0038 [candidate division TM6 bacterium GW2011_GWF2_36_131]KKQ19578.1 MAG: hypothetical protein US32_C0007G0031 [candidate division TM6 bacterium GW2011_GWA2_36_9]
MSELETKRKVSRMVLSNARSKNYLKIRISTIIELALIKEKIFICPMNYRICIRCFYLKKHAQSI